MTGDGPIFHVDLPYKWRTLTETHQQCASADAKAYGIYVDLTDRGKTAEGWPVYRFWSPAFMLVQHFRNECCWALGWKDTLTWETVIRSEYTADLPFEVQA